VQSVENQKYEILKLMDEKKLTINKWVEETVSTKKKVNDRKLGDLLQQLQADDILIVSEISRLGRNLMEIMGILHKCMENNIKVFTTKERYELGNNVSSKILAFAFSLSAEVERNLISQRTKEALQRKKREGKPLGRPKGSLSKVTKLSGKKDVILDLLAKKVPIATIGRILGVHRLTVDKYIKTRNLKSVL
jgi:DNA invertase Pin-like site-specific DNA recombinase